MSVPKDLGIKQLESKYQQRPASKFELSRVREHIDHRLNVIEAKIDDLLNPGSKDIIEERYRKEIG